MRKALNENPVVQVVMLGALGIFVAFLFMTRVMGSGSSAEEAPETPAPGAAATTSAPATPGMSATADPATAVPAPATPAPAPGTAEGFEAGAGLPARVVKAYEGGDVVALLVVQKKGAADKRLESEAQAVRARSDTSVFVVDTKEVASYSRIASGVDLDRAPALVVVEPRGEADGGLPAATVTYGFRGSDSLEQAVRDALYSGKQLPYHPG